jgi:NTP pyrophosphatase (non-canonical NTP hydrolase)
MTAISNAEYRKFTVGLLSDAKTMREGMRSVLRKTHIARTYHCVQGAVSEVLELWECVGPWVCGIVQRGALDENNLREELGDALFYTVAACKLLHVQAPSLQKRVHLNCTPAAAMLALTGQASKLIDLTKKVCYGQALNLEALQAELGVFAYTLWGVIEILTGEKPDSFAASNKVKLDKRYAGKFTTEASVARIDKSENP